MTLTTAEASTFVLTPEHKRGAASCRDVLGLTYKGEDQFTANFLSRRHHPPPHDRARLHPLQLAPESRHPACARRALARPASPASRSGLATDPLEQSRPPLWSGFGPDTG